MAGKETEVQSAICEYLTAKRLFFVRLNNIPASYLDRNENFRFRKLGKYAVPGLADILVIKNGHPYFIEVKRPKGGVISPEQHEFMRVAIIAGATYFIAKSIDDVQAQGL